MSKLKYKLDGIYKTLMESYSDTPFMSALIAGSLATIGLAINSTSTVIASALISPIGTFIIQANLLQFLKKYNYNFKGLKNSPWYIPLLLVVITTLVVSYSIGKAIIFFDNPFTGEPLNKDWPTREMGLCSNPMNGIYFVPIALLCGLLLPLLIVNNNISGFVGIGIACSMLPPIANIGLSLNFKYNPLVHPPELKNYKKNAVFTGTAIFLINLVLLLLPSRLLMDSILSKNNIFEKIESVFNF
jgi:hypothetical protein